MNPDDNPIITWERLLTLARKPFDANSISVVVRNPPSVELPFQVQIRDELRGGHGTVVDVRRDQTEAEVEKLMQDAGLMLGFFKLEDLDDGHDKIGNDTTD